MLSYVILSVCRNGINFVDITTVDNEIVDAEKQMGEVKKEVPEMQLKRMDSLKVKKEKWLVYSNTHRKDTCYNTSASSTRNIHPHLYRITIANTEQTTCSTSSHRVRFFSDMGPNRYKNTLMSV